jgi:hypothetical protein
MLGRILCGGNSSDFPWLDAELKKRGIKPVIHDLRVGGRIYLFKDEDISKLPTDEAGPYLGNNDHGFSIYTITPEMIEDLKKD